MTETTLKKDPFDFLFFYEFEDGVRQEDALLIGDDPSTASLLHLAIGLKDAAKIVIRSISGRTIASSTNYHFKLQFTSGILIQPENITVEEDNWGLEVEGDTILYLLWKGEEVIIEGDDFIELKLKGVMATLAPISTASQTNVTLSWEFKQDGIEIIDVTARDPGDSNPYNTTATEILEMIKRQGQANIPLYVGFYSSNRVCNVNDQESSLKLRITNTSESDITFLYDSEDTANPSQLVIALEVGDATNVPWALGKADDVNGIGLDIDGWTKTGPKQTGQMMEWTFTPSSTNAKLAAKQTLKIELTKIKTSHPTGTANLYLRYKYVPDYQDGEFICPIEKAPLVFDNDKDVGIGTSTPQAKLHVQNGDAKISGKADIGGNALISGNVGIGTTNPQAKLEIQNGKLRISDTTRDKKWELAYLNEGEVDAQGNKFYYFYIDEYGKERHLVILDGGNVGIGTTNPQAKLDVNGWIKGHGAVTVGMILMWSGSTTDIPTGWKLCDGTNGTPNLKDRFIVGAGGEYLVKAEGGNKTITLSIDQMPSHSHGVTDTGHSHTVDVKSRTGRSDDANDRDVRLPGSESVSTNHVTSNISIQSTGGGDSFDNRPPYYALCFIMKVNI